MQKYNITKWYTIVEILVVLMILVILWTIWFISYTWYLVWVRDTSRKVDLDNIWETLSVYNVSKWIYPLPSNAKDIKMYWTKIWSQWDFWESVVEELEWSKNYIVDPLTDNYYTYSVTDTRKEYQLAAAMESDEEIAYNWLFINKVQASSKKPWKALVRWSYNWQIKYFSTGWVDYVIALPSIITSDLSDLDLEHIITSDSLVYNNFYNLPASYSDSVFNTKWGFKYIPYENKFVIFSWSLDDFEEEYDRLDFIYNLQEAYSGTVLEWIWSINDLITSEIDLNDPGLDVSNLACDIIEYNLNLPINCNYKSFLTFYLLDDEDIITDPIIPEWWTEPTPPEWTWESTPLTIDLSNLPPKSTIYSVFKDSNDNIWFWTNKWLWVYDSTNDEWHTFDSSSELANKKVVAINWDDAWNVWFWTSKWISKFDWDFVNPDWNIYTDKNSLLVNKKIVSIFVDNTSNTTWIWTHKWVSVVDSNWNFIDSYENIPSVWKIEHVYSIARSSEGINGSIWFATSKWVFRYNLDSDTWFSYKNELLDKKVYYVLAGLDSYMWFWTKEWISRYNLNTGEWTNFDSDNDDDEDNDGNSDWDEVIDTDWLIWKSVNSIFQQSTLEWGTLWFWTDNWVISLSYPDLETWTPYPKDENWEIIYAIYDDWTFKILWTNDDWTTYEIN